MQKQTNDPLVAVFDRVRQQANKDVWDEQARDDVVSDCMLVLLEKQSEGALDGIENVEAYAMSVFNLLLHAHIRKSRQLRERVVRLPANYENVLQENTTPLTECADAELQSLVARAIDSLRQSRDRLVIRLWYIDDRASSEIAQQVRLPQHRLHGVVHRARERLRPRLTSIAL